MKHAVIDVGSNSVRLAMIDGRQSKKTIRTTQLAGGATDGVLRQENILLTAQAIKDFSSLAACQGYEVHVFATEAVRSALNKDVFIKTVRDLCGVEVDVIDGNTEALLSYLGACGKSGKKCVLDVGGASSEIAAGQDGTLLYALSIPMGAVRLRDKFGSDFDGLKKFVNEAVTKYSPPPCDEYLSVGGTATSLAAMMLELRYYDPQKTDGAFLSRQFLQHITADLKRRSVPEILAAYPSLVEKRAQVILYGAEIMLAVCDRLGIGGFTVKEQDNAEGYLIYKGFLQQPQS